VTDERKLNQVLDCETENARIGEDCGIDGMNAWGVNRLHCVHHILKMKMKKKKEIWKYKI
jgi:hypothetical protein